MEQMAASPTTIIIKSQRFADRPDEDPPDATCKMMTCGLAGKPRRSSAQGRVHCTVVGNGINRPGCLPHGGDQTRDSLIAERQALS